MIEINCSSRESDKCCIDFRDNEIILKTLENKK